MQELAALKKLVYSDLYQQILQAAGPAIKPLRLDYGYGTAFYPGGYGIWVDEGQTPETLHFPKDICVLSSNFTSFPGYSRLGMMKIEEYYKLKVQERIEPNPAFQYGEKLWENIVHCITELGVPMTKCYFTTYFPYGIQSEAILKELKKNENLLKLQWQFMIEQLKIVQPIVIWLVGREAPKMFHKYIKGLPGSWEKARFVDIPMTDRLLFNVELAPDLPKVNLILTTHPSINANLPKNQFYADGHLEGRDAIKAMLMAALSNTPPEGPRESNFVPPHSVVLTPNQVPDSLIESPESWADAMRFALDYNAFWRYQTAAQLWAEADQLRQQSPKDLNYWQLRTLLFAEVLALQGEFPRNANLRQLLSELLVEVKQRVIHNLY